jgi:hypothetical protein
MSEKTVPIETIELFTPLNEALFELMDSLQDDEWLINSPIAGRTVKDLFSHILDGTLRRLSYQRDGFQDTSRQISIESYRDLVTYIQKLNTEWISSTRRLSPRILRDLLKVSEPQLAEFFTTLDPFTPAPFSVAWAGEDVSANWFDIAREFTEKWHHQMQIRRALDRPLLLDTMYVRPFYQTCLLGLPRALSKITDAEEGMRVRVSITGNTRVDRITVMKHGVWRNLEGFALDSMLQDRSIRYDAEVAIPEDVAWILFTNTDRNKEAYHSSITASGRRELIDAVLDMVTVMS